MIDHLVQTQALQLATRLKAFCTWSGWYGTAPEPAAYEQLLFDLPRPLDERNTVVKILTEELLQAREETMTELKDDLRSRTEDWKLSEKLLHEAKATITRLVKVIESMGDDLAHGLPAPWKQVARDRCQYLAQHTLREGVSASPDRPAGLPADESPH